MAINTNRPGARRRAVTSDDAATDGAVAGRRGREYLRVSLDRSGRERSQDEQHEDNARACALAGITLLGAYRETGSASRYAAKARDDFARLLDDVERGRFDADVLVLWESSRGSRRVGEWVTLIELCEQHGIGIFVTMHGREYDPANPRDRRSLLEDAVDSEYESSKMSARVTRAHAANAAAGLPSGVTPFGYVRRYDERTRKFVAQEPHPDEAPVVREVFERIQAGHSLRSISRDLGERGVTSRAGRPFSQETIRTMALTAAYAGIRVHRTGAGKGAGSGGSQSRLGAPGVEATTAVWPGLVSRAQFLAVQQILSDPKRRTSRPGRAKHLLSLIARCEVCGAGLAITYKRRESGQYQCQRGHVLCDKEELDVLAEEAMLGYLGRPDVHERLTAGESSAGADLGRVRDELAEARSELARLREHVSAGRVSVASLVAAEPGMLARVGALEAEETRLATPSVLRGLITPGEDVAARWEGVPMSARRDIARLLFVPEVLGELRVAPRPPGWGHGGRCLSGTGSAGTGLPPVRRRRTDTGGERVGRTGGALGRNGIGRRRRRGAAAVSSSRRVVVVLTGRWTDDRGRRPTSGVAPCRAVAGAGGGAVSPGWRVAGSRAAGSGRPVGVAVRSRSGR
jgi:DNA invertase Pin-like site-specific DNA recombinase